MTATANLENDHIHILLLTAIMEEMTKKNELITDHLEKVINLIKQFADGIHHNKEENLLFPKMAEKGYSVHQGPLAVMLQEHQMGRNYVKGIVDGLNILRSESKTAVASIHANLIGYVELLRAHIAKENNILFRMADNVLSSAEQSSMLQQFTNLDKGYGNNSDSISYVREIEKLANYYNVQ